MRSVPRKQPARRGRTHALAGTGRISSARARSRSSKLDTDSIGIGVRALVNGAWGFAASQTLTADGVAAAAREAAAIAKANRIPGAAPVVLAPAPAYKDVTWKS